MKEGVSQGCFVITVPLIQQYESVNQLLLQCDIVKEKPPFAVEHSELGFKHFPPERPERPIKFY